MHKKIILLILLLLTLFSSATFPFTTLATTTTTISVDPQRTTGLDIDETFTIDITVSNVVDLYTWGFHLYYKNAVLNATERTEGPFLKQGGTTFMYEAFWNDNYNETHGLAYLTCTLTGAIPGVDGNGTLATITFKTKGTGDSILDLTETNLIDSATPFGHDIPHTAIDGTVHVGLRDVAITNIQAPKSVASDTIVPIDVTAENQGEITQTFDVTLFYDGTPIETKTLVSMPGGVVTILNFTWDTTPIPLGEYTLSAEATTVPGEVDLADNTYVYGTIYVGIRDIAITNTIPSKTCTNDTTVYIDVIIANNGEPGTPPQTFDITVYYNITPIETKTVTNLAAGSTTTLTFPWDTTPILKGKYRISSMATTVPGETSTVDNTYTDGWITETILGDLDGDYEVKIKDIAMVAKAFGSKPGDPNWEPNGDINNDGEIKIYDVATVSRQFGKKAT